MDWRRDGCVGGSHRVGEAGGGEVSERKGDEDRVVSGARVVVVVDEG